MTTTGQQQRKWIKIAVIAVLAIFVISTLFTWVFVIFDVISQQNSNLPTTVQIPDPLPITQSGSTVTGSIDPLKALPTPHELMNQQQ